jgi:tetratricopeptide (TPR) repeat protein
MAALAALTGLDKERAHVIVGQLAAAHLVQPSGPDRYTAHDLLRLYMKQRAEAEDGQAACTAATETLLNWYLDHARAAARVLHPHMLRLADLEHPPPAASFADHAAAVDWLDAERPNLVSAIDHAAAYGPQSVAWLLADVLRGYFWLRGHVVDWLRIGRVARAAAVVSADPRGQAVAHISLAFAHYSQGRYRRAIDNYRTALELCTSAGWEPGRATALGNLGLTEAHAGYLREAVGSLEAAARIDERLGRSLGLATTLRALGHVKAQLGLLQEALRSLRQALTHYEQAGSASGQAMTLATLADVLRMLGRFDEAAGCGARALDIHRGTGDPDGESGALEILARIHHDAGRHRDAFEHATASLALIERTDRRRGLAATLNILGRSCLARGDVRQAIAHHEQAVATTSTSESRFDRLEAEAGLAVALCRAGDPDAALVRATHALDGARQVGYRILAGEVLGTLADIHLARGSIEESRACARQAHEIHRELGVRWCEAAVDVARPVASRHVARPGPDPVPAGTGPSAAAAVTSASRTGR